MTTNVPVEAEESLIAGAAPDTSNAVDLRLSENVTPPEVVSDTAIEVGSLPAEEYKLPAVTTEEVAQVPHRDSSSKVASETEEGTVEAFKEMDRVPSPGAVTEVATTSSNVKTEDDGADGR